MSPHLIFIITIIEETSEKREVKQLVQGHRGNTRKTRQEDTMIPESEHLATS